MNVISECIVAAGPITPTATWPAGHGQQTAVANTVSVVLSADTSPAPNQPLHRLGEVRRQEGLTRRQVAGRLGISVGDVQQRERPSSDMLLSELHRWQKALAVPIAELLDEPSGELSPPVQLRAQLLRVMKTVRSLQQRARQAPMQRLVETLIAQLVEVMPELGDIAAWPMLGPRRRSHEYGQAFYRRLSLDPLDEMEQPEG